MLTIFLGTISLDTEEKEELKAYEELNAYEELIEEDTNKDAVDIGVATWSELPTQV